MSEIVIKIPKEFEEHFNSDRFEDTLQRIRQDIKMRYVAKDLCLSGNYEIETLDMLTEAFKECTPLKEWLSTFNTDSATACYTAVQRLKESVNENSD